MQTPTTNRIQAIGLAALLLTAGSAGAKAPHKGQAVTDTKTITLSGQVAGTWAPHREAADGGPGRDPSVAGYDLSGNGALGPLGPVRVAGSLWAPGPSARAHGPGTLTLTAPGGTLTLALSGGAPTALAAPLGAMAPAMPVTFTVTGGTGAFAGGRGAGTAQLVMTPQRRPAVVPGRLTPHFIVAAMFTLTFGAGRAPQDTVGASTPLR